MPTAATVSQNTVHSPSSCASASSAMRSSRSVVNRNADSARKTMTPKSQARMARVVPLIVPGSNGTTASPHSHADEQPRPAAHHPP